MLTVVTVCKRHPEGKDKCSKCSVPVKLGLVGEFLQTEFGPIVDRLVIVCEDCAYSIHSQGRPQC